MPVAKCTPPGSATALSNTEDEYIVHSLSSLPTRLTWKFNLPSG